MKTKYQLLRDWENLQYADFKRVGIYGVPEILPTNTDCASWVGFNFAKSCKNRSEYGLHFFVDDYQFNRLWTDPDKYLPMLKQFKAVMSPDFSTYRDFPYAVQAYNQYRRQWLGAYWQMHGMTVVPTLDWGSPDTYDYCFDGMPKNSTLGLSSVGVMREKEAVKMFIDGFHEMLDRLSPTRIIMQGPLPKECDTSKVKIVKFRAFQERFREPKFHTK